MEIITILQHGLHTSSFPPPEMKSVLTQALDTKFQEASIGTNHGGHRDGFSILGYMSAFKIRPGSNNRKRRGTFASRQRQWLIQGEMSQFALFVCKEPLDNSSHAEKSVLLSTKIANRIKYQPRPFMVVERAPNGDGEEKAHRTGTSRKVKS